MSPYGLLRQLFVGLILGVAAQGQITFRTTDFPSRIGVDTWRLREDASGKSITQLLGSAGGPHKWDFSYPSTEGETVRATAIVAPDDGNRATHFPSATYAERETIEKSGCQTWNYLRLTDGMGRIQSGFFSACKDPGPYVIFESPSIEVPDNLKFGDTFQQTADWRDDIGGDFFIFRVAVHYVSTAKVDAYGTIVLPGIGEVPALRVNELNSYETTELENDIPLDKQYFRNYYWLVPGIGRAVQLSSPAGTSAPPANFSVSQSIFRVFESGRYPQRQFVKNLGIARQGNQILLSWEKENEATQYEVEYSTRLAPVEPWILLASPPGNSFLDAIGLNSSRFYRVFWRK
jgi:hypothetical protein